MNKAGIYIHIPFCRSKCPYCDFYSMRLKDGIAEEYTDSLVKKIKELKNKYSIEADTLYIGGGTPSIIGADNIIKIVEASKAFGRFDEITVECNPSSVEDNFFRKASSAGVNRISLGLQSAVDSERHSLGRIAGIKEVKKCIADANNAGIDNISLDVMIGIPNQSEKTLDETLSFCADSGAKHISAYMLKLEENTFYYKNRSKLNLPDDDFTADSYLKMVSFLEDKGFNQYEISNFAKSGYESCHNLKYWNCEEYLGIGPAAHSFINGKRFFYPRDIEYFMSGGEPVQDGTGGDIEEYIMLGLRLKKGIMYEMLRKKYSAEKIESLKNLVSKYEKNGFVLANENGFNLTPKGFLISNTLIESIICHFE